MILKIYNINNAEKIFLSCYVKTNILLILVSTYGFYSGAGFLATTSGIFYLTISLVLTLNKRFIDNPFSILFCFSSLIFFNIPATFILVEGGNYIFGDGLATVPYLFGDYAQNLWLGFLYLSILWASIWAGLVSIDYKKIEIRQLSLSKISNTRIIFLGFIVLIITWIDSQSIMEGYLEKAEKLFNISAFILFDQAYLLLAGIIIYFKINDLELVKNYRNIINSGSTIFLCFVMLSFLSGSKGAILIIFIFFILIPFSFSRHYSVGYVVGPSIITSVLLLIFSPIIFYLALLQRINLAGGIVPTLGTYLSGVSAIDMDVANTALKQMLYRLSWGGVDRFILLFQSFIFEDFNFSFVSHFLTYLGKNTLNLLLPGTPFSEAYYPSSQFFSEVLSKNLISSDGDYIQLMTSLNTQAYTIFGIFIILFGIIAPIFLYIFTLFLVFVFNRINSVFIRVSILYFWMMSLSSYGIEVVIGNSAHVYLSIWLMYMLIGKHNKFNLTLLWKKSEL